MIDVQKLERPYDLRTLMENAKRLGNEEVYWQAFRRLCEVEGETGSDDPLETEFYMILAAYEELLTIKNGRRTAASRTRQKLKKKGFLVCLIDWALQPNTTQGFELLVENDQGNLTAEYLVVKNAARFDEHVVDAARTKLKRFGVT